MRNSLLILFQNFIQLIRCKVPVQVPIDHQRRCAITRAQATIRKQGVPAICGSLTESDSQAARQMLKDIFVSHNPAADAIA